MAFDSITYANSSRLQLQGDRAAVIGPKFGMQPGPFKDLVESGKYRGSIVFGQLPKGTSGMYEGGERLGEGVQSLTDITPHRIQELPESIVHDTTGAKFEYFDKYSNRMRRMSLSPDMLKEPEFADWMKQFAQNLKDTIPEGGYLPPGTKELLPSEFFEKTPVEFANGSIRYTEDGKSFFLHHSPSSEIKVGQRIRTTQAGAGMQVTAADAIAGHSYAWDARTGLADAVANQVSLRGNFSVRDSTHELLPDFSPEPGKSTAKDFSVYLTSADTKNVYPDINVPGSAARAIKGEQEVLDKISIPANLSDEEATDLVRQMMRKHGVFQVDDTSVKKMINESVLATSGEEALGNFLEAHGEGIIRSQIKAVEKQLAEGGRKGVYIDQSILPLLGKLGRVVETEGADAAFAFAKKEFTPAVLKLDTSQLSAEVSSRAMGTTQVMVDKAVQAQKMIASARSTSSLFDMAKNTSEAVAAGTKNSRSLRAIGAAAAVFKSRF